MDEFIGRIAVLNPDWIYPPLQGMIPVAMVASVQKLGIIAGNRSLPIVLAQQARASGVKELVAIGFTGETDPQLQEHVDQLVWLRVGQLNKLIRALQQHEVRYCVMGGQIAPRNLFDLRPDFRGLNLLLRLKEKNAHTIFGAIADELYKEGIELIEAVPWLQPLMPAAGFRVGPKLSEILQSDADYGFRIAKEISRLEIGQTVVVKEGSVLAVEGFEGTDRCLQRGGGLAGRQGGAVAVKVAKEKHDMRFDIPCVGAQTLEICASAGIKLLAVEGQKTLLLDRDQLEALCCRLKVTLIAL